jgi:hypothetical protein
MSNRDRAKMIRALFAAYLTNDCKAVEDAFTEAVQKYSGHVDSVWFQSSFLQEYSVYLRKEPT